MTDTANIDSLPVETFIDILTKIDGNTLGRCRRVCLKWKECIDEIDHILWQKMCDQDFPFSSTIAKRKCGNSCGWYHIYRNLKLWADLTKFEKNVKKIYKFTSHDKTHVLNIDYGVLPLKDSKGIVLFDVDTLKYIPVAIPERNCIKIVNNDQVTIIHTKSGILVQRTTNSPQYATEKFFRADNFVLANDVYFCDNRDIYKCDLNMQELIRQMIIHCDYDIKEMVFSEGLLHVFTDCGQIVNINKNKEITVKPLNCPIAWIKQIKHVCAVNDKNFVCYSRNLFKIETDKYKHLYLEFPPITALFFYVDIVLIGTRAGEILLYRLSSQKKARKPIFETLAVLPDGKFPVQLDVCERRTGPLIVASTFFELFLIDINFFPNELKTRHSFTTDKLEMYKRLLKLKNRF